MATIDLKQDALREIELLTDKVRQIKISQGIHAADGYRFKYDIAVAWDGSDPVPQAIQDLADYRSESPLRAKGYIMATMDYMQELFRSSDVIKYNAKKEIEALSDDATPEQVRAVYEKHLAIFESVIDANI